MSTKPVFYFTRMLPAYRIPILERLNERLDGRLVVCHGQPPQGNPVLMKDIESTFQRETLTNYWYKDTTVHLQFYRKVFKKHGPPSVVLAEESPRSVMLPGLLRRARKVGAGRVLWGIFYSVHRPFSAKHPLQRYRIAMANRVEACACYAKQSRTYLQPHVAPEKLFVAQNTMDTNTLFALRNTLEAEGKAAVRLRLGIPADHDVFVFVAQLVARKGTRELIEIFESYQRTKPATLIVIGGGPERENMETLVAKKQLQHVQFLGAISDLHASAPYIFAADIMLQPGYVGLVVNHAFALGVPVVTQEAPGNLPFHGPEVESIEHGSNGMIVARNNMEAMQAALKQVTHNQEVFSQAATTYAETKLTMDNQVDGLIAAIAHAEQTKKS
ncbi:MAG: glycosyltransferase [Bacteroidota bacterium]